MSTDRKSESDLGTEASAILDADLRLDARLRQRLLASSHLVPEPSAHMLAALQEAARQQAASNPAVHSGSGLGPGGIVAWLASRPRHMWAALGSVAVGGAAVAGLVMLQKSSVGVDRQAAGMVARAELTQAEAPGAVPAQGGAVAPAAATPTEALPNQDASRGEKDVAGNLGGYAGGKRADGISAKAAPRAQAGEGKADVKLEASDGDKFAQAPKGSVVAELEEDADDSRFREVPADEGAESKKEKGSAPTLAKAAKSASAPRPVVTSESSTQFSTDDSVSVGAAAAPAAPSPPAAKPLAIDVRGLAKAGRCTEASKAAAARRKSDAAYTAAKAEEDMAPCRTEAVKSRAKSAPVKK